MADVASYQAIFFPSDDRLPHLVTLNTTLLHVGGMPAVAEPFRCGRMPRPEIFMDYIGDGMGALPWAYKVIDILDGMSQGFTTPYILFYPVVSRDHMPFPLNQYVSGVQGRDFFEEARAWRGNLVIAKYSDMKYSAMTNASMADFPIVKNWLKTHRME